MGGGWLQQATDSINPEQIDFVARPSLLAPSVPLYHYTSPHQTTMLSAILLADMTILTWKQRRFCMYKEAPGFRPGPRDHTDVDDTG